MEPRVNRRYMICFFFIWQRWKTGAELNLVCQRSDILRLNPSPAGPDLRPADKGVRLSAADRPGDLHRPARRRPVK